jgi:hypothetical protein
VRAHREHRASQCVVASWVLHSLFAESALSLLSANSKLAECARPTRQLRFSKRDTPGNRAVTHQATAGSRVCRAHRSIPVFSVVASCPLYIWFPMHEEENGIQNHHHILLNSNYFESLGPTLNHPPGHARAEMSLLHLMLKQAAIIYGGIQIAL